MTQITATASGSTPITATVTPSGVVASAAPASLAVTVGGGIGPQGLPGAAVSNLSDLADVNVENLAPGDLLRREGQSWKNYPESELIVDAGNF